MCVCVCVCVCVCMCMCVCVCVCMCARASACFILTRSNADPPPKYSIIIHSLVPWERERYVNKLINIYNIYKLGAKYGFGPSVDFAAQTLDPRSVQ